MIEFIDFLIRIMNSLASHIVRIQYEDHDYYDVTVISNLTTTGYYYVELLQS